MAVNNPYLQDYTSHQQWTTKPQSGETAQDYQTRTAAANPAPAAIADVQWGQGGYRGLFNQPGRPKIMPPASVSAIPAAVPPQTANAPTKGQTSAAPKSPYTQNYASQQQWSGMPSWVPQIAATPSWGAGGYRGLFNQPGRPNPASPADWYRQILQSFPQPTS